VDAEVDGGLLPWPREGDPSIRPVLRDLTDTSSQAVARQQARVATNGWGARPLAIQDSDGHWGGGAYSSRWILTTYILPHVLWLGLPLRHPATLRGCERRGHWQARWRVPETCIVSIRPRLTSSHRDDAARLDDRVEYLLGQQPADGGWNCAKRTDKSKHRSSHTSIQALEALDAYTSAAGPLDASESVRAGPRILPRPPAVAVTSHPERCHPRQHPIPAFPEWHLTCSAASSTSARPVLLATNGCATPSRRYAAPAAKDSL
jgi:hypothetical protein